MNCHFFYIFIFFLMNNGTVKFFNEAKGFGFITPMPNQGIGNDVKQPAKNKNQSDQTQAQTHIDRIKCGQVHRHREATHR